MPVEKADSGFEERQSLSRLEPADRHVFVGARNQAEHDDSFPEVLLPSQFFERGGLARFSSEQRLMLAVLIDAINVVRQYRLSANGEKRAAFNEASSWVFAVTQP